MVDDFDVRCHCCGMLDNGHCSCAAWPADCWVGEPRPWSRHKHNGIFGPPNPRLTPKGIMLRAECRAEQGRLTRGLDRRTNIRKARRRWMVLKDAVDARRIALHWQEQTQRRLCGPGGAGRAADAAAFRDEF